MNKQKTFRWLFIIAVILNILLFANLLNSDDNYAKDTLETIQYAAFLQDVKENNIQTIYYKQDVDMFYVETKNNVAYQVLNPEYEMFKKDMMEHGIDVQSTSDFHKPIEQPSAWAVIRGFLIIGFTITGCIFGYKYFSLKKKSNITIKVAKNYENNNKTTPNNKELSVKTFKDVAGLEEVKKDMKSLVDFMKNSERYYAAGAKLPRGVIFYGPPGTGKTLLAKAVAGEAGIPFCYMSGSDFAEKYVGVGAQRIRELFEKARKIAPCIVFIDEIDAIGGNRANDDSNGEDRKTLNALLAEMDGFKSVENILVIAATNRIDDLDPALLRPGRFTNKFCVPVPETTRERLEIIKMYSRNKKFSDNVDFDRLAKETMGFSPAAIESLLNEAAIISVQDRKPCIDKDSVEKAMFKILLSGHMKENQSERNPEELQLVAWHEAGHALIGKLNGKEIPKVTIIASTSGAGGVTFSTPKKTGLYSVDDLKNEVKELYAGRIAELLLLKNKNKVTTGASNDIEKATKIIREIVTSYGMNDDFGLLNLNHLRVSQDVIIEREIALAKEIEKETLEVLTQYYPVLKTIAEQLLENETLYESDLSVILEEMVGAK